MRESREPVHASRQISAPCYLVLREWHEEASASTARVLPTTELASVEVCSRPDNAAPLDASPPRGLPAWSGDPSPGKQTSPHGDKLRGGGTREGGVLVMSIARRGQAPSWRTCRREKTAERPDARMRSDRRRDRASASHHHRDSPTATKTNRSPLTFVITGSGQVIIHFKTHASPTPVHHLCYATF